VPPPVTTRSPLALVVLVALVALAQWGARRVGVARGARPGDAGAGWRGGRWADTVLVSPLFAGGTLMAVAALDWALARAALQLAARGHARRGAGGRGARARRWRRRW
jgi:hypothetical protein